MARHDTIDLFFQISFPFCAFTAKMLRDRLHKDARMRIP
jgi:hypothetical protein